MENQMGKGSTSHLELFAQPIAKNAISRRIDNGEVLLLNPRNQDFLDGKTQRLGAGSDAASMAVLLLFFIPFLAIGIFAGGWAILHWQEYSVLNQLGVTGTGEITDKRIVSYNDGDIYYVSYTHSSSGISYEAEQWVEREFYDGAAIGAPMAIDYVPDNPKITSLAGRNTFPYFPLAFSFFWNLFIWPLFLALVSQMWRNRLLVKEGKLLKGRVISTISSVEGDDNDFYVNVRYGFVSPDTGEMTTGITNIQRDRMGIKPIPTQGTSIAVLYRNNQHYTPL